MTTISNRSPHVSVRQSRRNRIAKWMFVLILVANCSPLECHAQERTISFPSGWDHATISVYDQPQISDNLTGFLKFDWAGETIGIATGEIRIPNNSFVGIEVNGTEGYEEYLAELPESGIQSLELSNATLSDSVIKSLERLETLRVLKLVNCGVADPKPSELNGLPNLQYLLVSRPAKGSSALHQTISLWAARCPQLQYYFDGESLSAEEILRFSNHQAPLFVKVSFDANAIEVIGALGQVPKLIGLNVDVTADAPQQYHLALNVLKQVELFNWSGGQLDKHFLDSMAELKRLRTIRFQGNPEVADEFIENLAELKSLEAISFNNPLSEHQAQILPEILIGMNNILALPELRDVSAEQLEKLSKRTDIVTLRMSGLGANASEQQLATVIRSNSRLTWLDLSRVKFTPEIADAICQCKRLSHLSLTVRDFDGKLLTAPEQLQSLNSLSLDIEIRPSGLSTLAQIPSLTELQISLKSLNPTDWAFISEMKTLRSLVVTNGFCDDTIVNWLKRNKSLRGFHAGEDCIMTDAGVDELRKCKQLETLSIGGIISAASIERLGQLPNLRRLSVRTNLPDDASINKLREQFRSLEYFGLGELRPSIAIGDDSFFRRVPKEGRTQLDELEGVTLKKVLGSAMTEELQEQLNGKVVLIEFWGTWCGPCLNFVPELERLQTRYGDQGFQVVTIHTTFGSEAAEAYLEKHPKPWPNLIDKDKVLQNRFSVPSFPSTYIFGRDGTLQIAIPYRHGLDRPLTELLGSVPE